LQIKTVISIMKIMIEIEIKANDGGRRLDRFLKKYFGEASLSHIYRMIRKDVKVNGRRSRPEAVLTAGDTVKIYITEEEAAGMRTGEKEYHALRQFRIAYEDDDLIIVEKPFGLLTHGDQTEKKNTLSNQVCAYLIATGAFDPRAEQTFVPAPVNRLDRNTTGLVIFGKNAASLKRLNACMRSGHEIKKYYLTITAGEMEGPMDLRGRLAKNSRSNTVEIVEKDGKEAATSVRPLKKGGGYTLAEAELITGRTHQIRVQLAGAGYPLIGDTKYGSPAVNAAVRKKYGLTTQLLHAYRLEIPGSVLSENDKKDVIVAESEPPERFCIISADIFG